MDNRDSYTPEEVAEMCFHYRRVKGGFDGPVHATTIQNYEEHVPENIREIINQLESLSYDQRAKKLEFK